MTKDQQTPMMEADEIAGLLGWSPRWFNLQKKKLIAEHGMPAPLPGRRWHRATVMRWIETYGDLKARAGSLALCNIRIAHDRDRLSERYSGGTVA